jgi:hypothetical protein
MSRGYRIRWERVTTTVKGRDQHRIPLALLEILAPDEMCALLAEELAAEGWRQKGGEATQTVGDVSATLDVAGQAIVLRVEREGRIEGSGRTADEAAQSAAKAREAGQARLKEDLVRALDAAEPTVREQVNRAVQRVYLRALERRAAALGEIESRSERVGEGGEVEITIRVRV